MTSTCQLQCVAVQRALQYSWARACVAHFPVGAAAAGVLNGPLTETERAINAAKLTISFIRFLLSMTPKHHSNKPAVRAQQATLSFTGEEAFSLTPITFLVCGRSYPQEKSMWGSASS
jgi:hypothetical protein